MKPGDLAVLAGFYDSLAWGGVEAYEHNTPTLDWSEVTWGGKYSPRRGFFTPFERGTPCLILSIEPPELRPAIEGCETVWVLVGESKYFVCMTDLQELEFFTRDMGK
jgi:hypothetical protein